MALMTVFLWGTTFIATKILLIDFKPIEILFFRFSLGYIVLWFLSPRFFAWQGIKQECMFLCAGLCGVTCYFLCENIALTYTTASNYYCSSCDFEPVFYFDCRHWNIVYALRCAIIRRQS
ncbi:DMT family transporter [Gilliamella sp. App4-10]|uniref:DMT family transporter n=1 Tax=Gilliamella sp. App4-10 TaxID=3120231 RepID=UPI00210012A2|nr:DMT family transporter [Gilliamella apicola]